MARLPSGDLFTWIAALVLSAGTTVIAWAAGARLGVALSLGVVVLAVVVLARLAFESVSETKSRT